MELLARGESWALASGVFWAVGVVLFARAGESIAPLPLNLFKDVVSLLFFVPLLAVTQQKLVPDWDLHTWLLVAASGVVGITVADTLFFMALNRLGAGLNAIVDCLYYPSMVTVAVLFLGEAVRRVDVVGGGLVVAGVLMASLGRAPAGRAARDVAAGVSLGALGMVLVAFGVALIDGVLAREPVLAVTAYRLLFGTLVLVPLNLASAARRRVLVRLARPSPLWRHALPAAVVGGALAMWAWLAGFAMTDVARAAVLNQLSTIWTFVLAALLLADPVTPRRLVALVLAFGGALLVLLG